MHLTLKEERISQILAGAQIDILARVRVHENVILSDRFAKTLQLMLSALA